MAMAADVDNLPSKQEIVVHRCLGQTRQNRGKYSVGADQIIAQLLHTIKPRNYQVAMLENTEGDEAMRLCDGFQFTTPQEQRNTMEILSAFDEFAMGEAFETVEQYKFNSRKQEDGESFEDVHAELRMLPKKTATSIINAQARWCEIGSS